MQSNMKFKVSSLFLAGSATVALIALPPGVAVRVSGATADGLIYSQLTFIGGGDKPNT